MVIDKYLNVDSVLEKSTEIDYATVSHASLLRDRSRDRLLQ